MPTLSNYKELKAFLEKEQPDWIRALIPRQIEASSRYWSQKVLATAALVIGFTL
jgi:hypothetical protein